MNINDHISELRKKTECIVMGYYSAQAEDGTMTSVGFRGKNRDIVIIDNIVWMICGSNCKNSINNNDLGSVDQINNVHYRYISLYVEAQAIISGSIVNVDLGKYSCVDRNTNESTLNIVRSR